MVHPVVTSHLAARSGRFNALKMKSEKASEVRKGAVECFLSPGCPVSTMAVSKLPTTPRTELQYPVKKLSIQFIQRVLTILKISLAFRQIHLVAAF